MKIKKTLEKLENIENSINKFKEICFYFFWYIYISHKRIIHYYYYSYYRLATFIHMYVNLILFVSRYLILCAKCVPPLFGFFRSHFFSRLFADQQ